MTGATYEAMLRRVSIPRLSLISPHLLLLLALLLIAPACGGDDNKSNPSTSASDDGGSPAAKNSGKNSNENSGDSSSESSPEVEANVRYLSMGDSVTQGVGADDIENESYPARLAKRWNDAGCRVELLNVGESGFTSGQVLEEQVPNIKDFKPTIITFQAGGNDIVYEVTAAQYRKNVAAVMDASVKSGAKVYVQYQNEWFRTPVGLDFPGSAEKRVAFDMIMAEEAKSRNITVLDLRPIYKQQADRKEWIEDGLHPTAKAYDAWAERLAALIPKPC